MYKKFKFDNGLKVVTCSMPKMRSVALGIWIKVGGRYESEENKGIAHFLEHLVFKGSKKYSCRKLKESIEGVGGALNGFTSEEVTCYLVKLPAEYLNLALDILSDMVINPKLPSEEISKEKTVIIEEIKMYKDLPQSYVYELLDESLWPQQPLGMPISGTVESVDRINKERLSVFQRQYYNPANFVISASGLFDEKKFIKKAEGIFSFLKAANTNAFAKAEEKQDKPKLKLLVKDTEQTHLALGFHSLRRDHPLKYALSLLHIILGANMSSRLFNELREKNGLAYEIGTQAKRFQDTGVFIVHAGIDNRKVEEAIRLILKELKKIKDKPVSRDEFKRAKEFYLGQLMLALEDTLDQMLWIGESTVTLDKVYSLNEVIKDINKVKLEDIRQVSRHIFKPQNLNLALIGPLRESEQKIYEQLYIG